MRSIFRGFLITAIFICSCEKSSVPAEISIQVNNSKKQVVADAEVKIDGELVGKTNDKGIFASKIDLTVGNRYRVEVAKDSADYYYAPYFDSFEVLDQKENKVDIRATLYFVPKPSNKNQLNKADVAVKPSEKSREDFRGEVPKETDQEVVDKNEKPESEKTEVAKTEVVTKPIERLKAPVANEDVDNSVYYTVHVYSGGQAVGGASVYVGDEVSGDIELGCKTNLRGRCVVKLKQKQGESFAFLVKKKSYQTATRRMKAAHRGMERINLSRGNAIDIFAMTRSYQYSRGISGVDVIVKGIKVGQTDRFGHLSYAYSGKQSDLVDVELKTTGFLPESFSTDFVISGPTSLIHYFTAEKPHSVKTALAPSQLAGKISTKSGKIFESAIDSNLERSIREHLFSHRDFSEVTKNKLNQGIQNEGKSIESLLRQGWKDTSLKGSLDMIVVPTIVSGTPMVIELSVIDSQAKVIAAAKEIVRNTSDFRSINDAVKSIALKIRRKFPFEGAVIAAENGVITTNFGTDSGRIIKAGDTLEVYGSQPNKLGNDYHYKKIATLEIELISGKETKSKVLSLLPRSIIRRGDLVTFRARQSTDNIVVATNKVVLRAFGEQDSYKHVLTKANVYFNEKWIGSTDAAGKVTLSKALGKGLLKVIKHGYMQFAKEITLENKKNIDIVLKKNEALLKVASVPSGLQVYVDSELIGKTPFAKPLTKHSGFVKVEVRGPKTFKDFSKIIDLSQGANFTGASKIILEKDLRSHALQLKGNGQFAKALEILKGIPANHSDYLLANHDIGEIYLNKLGNPLEASKYFGIVTSSPEVKNFVDKRFIGTHINQGIALFMIAENLATRDPAGAKLHYLKAAEKFESVSPQLRFVSKDEHADAAQTVAYHIALCQHKLWFQTNNQAYLNSAYKGWRAYLDTAVDQKAEKTSSNPMLDDAKVYFKQAEADINSLSGNSIVR